MLIVQSIEVTSFSFVWELRRVDDIVAGETLVSIVEVTVCVVGIKVVEGVDPGIVCLFSLLKIDKSIDM